MAYNIKCNSNGVFTVKVSKKGTFVNSKIESCVNRGSQIIQEYLSGWNLYIRPINKQDVKKLSNSETLRENLCGEDMADQLGNVIDEIIEYIEDDEAEGDYSNYEINNQVRLTYVLSPINNDKIIIGIVSAVINYNDPSLEINIGEFYDLNLKNKNSLYIEIGCSNQKKDLKQFATGTNYFIRAFILLKAFELKDVRLLWGSASGASHPSRSCRACR